MSEPTHRVVESYGRQLQVEDAQGQRHLALIKSKKTTALVGDWVCCHRESDSLVIDSVAARHNEFFRQDQIRTKSFAANIDQVLILIAAEPHFSDMQLMRSLIAAASQDIPAAIALNKSDLTESFALARHRLANHARWEVPLFPMQIKPTPRGLPELLAWMEGKSTLVVGPSGSGKSSLINTLVPHAQSRTQDLSKALHSGKHTTTRTTWYWLDAAHHSALIDSPGFQEFGLHHVGAQQLPWLMPDLRAHMGHCRFSNCSHLNEPQCSVRNAVEQGLIDATRYRIYCQLHDELSQ
ncbi:MAG: ribosome small subunit-dependent GTPase A [Betaproteobacteria bacterium]|jgi:ribosome biogenesis GTPase / thiamine phosphate phosphatase|nr:ribosome small subunit-dependent GTPase A [Betaproteobacteria bacterium]